MVKLMRSKIRKLDQQGRKAKKSISIITIKDQENYHTTKQK